jgi:signal peptidase I
MDRDQVAKLVRIAVAAAATVGLAVAAVVAKRRLVRLEVEGVSMVPVLAPGDRILVLRTDQIAVGDIIAFADPDGSDGALVKRASGIDRNSVRVEGDNFDASRDSRHFGPVPRSAIIGRVLWCYWSPYHPQQAGR